MEAILQIPCKSFFQFWTMLGQHGGRTLTEDFRWAVEKGSSLSKFGCAGPSFKRPVNTAFTRGRKLSAAREVLTNRCFTERRLFYRT